MFLECDELLHWWHRLYHGRLGVLDLDWTYKLGKDLVDLYGFHVSQCCNM